MLWVQRCLATVTDITELRDQRRYLCLDARLYDVPSEAESLQNGQDQLVLVTKMVVVLTIHNTCTQDPHAHN